MKRLLIAAAHPDDEVLGCFATAAKLIQMGYEVFTLILGRGKTARGETTAAELEQLDREMKKANGVIGVKEIFTYDFPDNMFDSVPLLKVVKAVEEVKRVVAPNIIITHHSSDINIDHRIVYSAVMTAARPIAKEKTQAIYSMCVPSSTEWNSYTKESAFIPNVFVDVTDTINLKLKVMEEYASELRDYPHPRSLRYLKDLAALNGAAVGLKFSENFRLVRKVGI